MALRPGIRLHSEEMNKIIDELFACQVPEVTPDGFKTFTIISAENIKDLFN